MSKVPIASKLLLIDDLKTLGSAIFAEKRYWDAFYLFRQALSLALFAKSEADEVKAASTGESILNCNLRTIFLCLFIPSSHVKSIR